MIKELKRKSSSFKIMCLCNVRSTDICKSPHLNQITSVFLGIAHDYKHLSRIYFSQHVFKRWVLLHWGFCLIYVIQGAYRKCSDYFNLSRLVFYAFEMHELTSFTHSRYVKILFFSPSFVCDFNGLRKEKLKDKAFRLISQKGFAVQICILRNMKVLTTD